MDIETIKQERDRYIRQQEELLKRRDELARMLENIDRQIVAHGGAIDALNLIIASEKTDGDQ